MSYGKKDEDADQAIVKVDRTAVFQEGTVKPKTPFTARLTENTSSPVQLLPHIAPEMPNSTYQNLSSPLYWCEFSSK